MIRLLWNQRNRGRHCQDFLSEDVAADAAMILSNNTAVDGIVLEQVTDPTTFDPSGPRSVTESKAGTTLDTGSWRGMPRSHYTPK